MYRNDNKVADEMIEDLRDGTYATTKNVIINPLEIKNVLSDSVEENFVEYLKIFKSNESSVKKLPYYLIPIVASLRFLLKEKLETNSFICENNDKIYSLLRHNKKYENQDAKMITNLYYYELESLIASSIGALTFTFLNKSVYRRNNTKDTSSLGFSIKENIKQNKNVERRCDNIYNLMKKYTDRSIRLKYNNEMNNLRRKTDIIENAIQIYAEFRSILIMNTFFLQSLKIMDDLSEFKSFYSMYHYLWEEAYYYMIDFFRINRENNIPFSQLFIANDNKNDDQYNDYINYLEEIYIKMLNVIVAN